MAIIDFKILNVGIVIALHYLRDSKDDELYIVGEITRIDKEFNQFCIKGYTYRNDRIEEIETWFMDYAYVRQSKPIAVTEYEEIKELHEKRKPINCISKFFQKK